MKKPIFIILLLYFMQENANAQPSAFSITYNRSTNTLVADFNPCNTCAFLNPNDAETCFCIQQCESNYQEDLETCENEPTYEQCKAIWEWEVANGETYSTLENECCPEAGIALNSCLNTCGEFDPSLSATPIAYTYTFVAAWAAIPFNPVNFPQNYVTYSGTGNNPANIPPWTVFDPWPNILNGSNNHCYWITYTILYDNNDDGISDWTCNGGERICIWEG